MSSETSKESPISVHPRPSAFAAFIETQFPVSKLSKESYKERKAGCTQTLTGLGKWWGRKPLILIRATILGLLLPASDNPRKDREIFLKILTMDEEGLWLRKSKSIPPKVQTLQTRMDADGRRWKREELQRLVFERLSYDQKLEYCAP